MNYKLTLIKPEIEDYPVFVLDSKKTCEYVIHEVNIYFVCTWKITPTNEEAVRACDALFRYGQEMIKISGNKNITFCK